MDHRSLKEAIRKGRYEWRRHTIERIMERNIRQQEVLQVLMEGEEIENYPEDTPYSSALYFRRVSDNPLHVAAAFDEMNEWAYIITAYVPDLEHFREDYRTRRRS